ncbi:hypothetical protein ACS9SB_0016555 [Bacillus subtilis]
MSVVVEFMNELFQDMDGTNWHITAMEEFKKGNTRWRGICKISRWFDV